MSEIVTHLTFCKYCKAIIKDKEDIELGVHSICQKEMEEFRSTDYFPELPFNSDDWYEISYWLFTLGSKPIKLYASEDKSESYEMNRFHVFGLENGQFASVYENGCSCYEPSEAEIDLYPNLESAMDKFHEWQFNYDN